jgi:hypothetical protein
MSTNYGAKYETARDRILDLMSDCEWHRHKELWKVGGVRYTARLLELRRLGYEMESRPSDDKHGKDYRLMSIERGQPQEKQVKVFLSESDAVALISGVITPTAEHSTLDALNSFQSNKHKL